MKGELYFEEHPWLRSCAAIRQRQLGPVFEIAIQIVCGDKSPADVLQLWLTRCEELVGIAVTGETLHSGPVVSFVGSAGDCVVRIFVDSSSEEETENFEIVTHKSLIVWKPGTSLQGRTTGGYTCARQQYVADLEVKA